MKYFIDFEFIENGKTIDPLSIGVVCEDGRELYYEFFDADQSIADDWVKEHVLPQLGRRNDPPHNQHYRWADEIRDELLDFCDPEKYGKLQFWGYYADYDWVALCQIFGTMMDLPKGWPKYCHDLKQWCDQLGNPQLPKQEDGEHNALADARWNRDVWHFLDHYEVEETAS